MLLLTRTAAARHLESYRTWERQSLAAPADCRRQVHFEDATYTPCPEQEVRS
ncbi:DUF5133 domain-containing protein [Streptomyces sp. NPDC005373]|uniref:DUF5133 domain-containing protein n=1 Tax=Streptomyces sp. NPDC005373 TaxID=3156879 RepID=UPI0033BD0183